jgi:LytS/YehU family sensor histidine kinase
MPRFVFQKKYLMYTFWLILALYAMLWVKFLLTYYLVSTNVWPEGPELITGPTLDYAVQTMLGELYVISFVTAIKITVDWLREHSKLHEVEKRQMATELRFLRSQISPHFFFNTLNNIYYLTLPNSPKAGDVILKLSEFMRYLLYATEKRKQTLRNEIDCLQNYIDLERIRFDDRLEVNVSITGALEGKKIAPMLLIPLVENCFKHGASKDVGKITIDMDIQVEENVMLFRLTNTIPPEQIESKVPTRSGGIGLSNIKKRLELGYAAKEYDFNASRAGDKFVVYLRLAV